VVTKNEVVRRIVKAITDGGFSAYDYQKVLTALGITDIIIEIVGQPTCDEVKGKINLVITIVSGTRTFDEIKVDLNRALKQFFQIPDDHVIKTTLERDTSTKKRAGSGGTVLQSSVIEPAPAPVPSSNPTPAPTPGSIVPANAMRNSGFMAIWLVGLISLLFLKR
jgi:hypothetical protein